MKLINGGRGNRMKNFDMLTTEQLLELHERHFAPLDAKSKERIVGGARSRGWDRTWDSTPRGVDGFAA